MRRVLEIMCVKYCVLCVWKFLNNTAINKVEANYNIGYEEWKEVIHISIWNTEV